MKSVKADLHLHTNYSDGNLSPIQLIDLSKKYGISVISITDHDNVNALEEAIIYGNQNGIQVIPGVEISADLDKQEVHILGYFIDYKDKRLLEFLSASRNLRIRRNEKIVRKLNEMGSTISFNDIKVKAGEMTSIGRPHIAMELNEEGFVKSYYDAFIKYIGDGKPAFVKKPNPKSSEVIRIISEMGGLSFIAHPGKLVRDELLISLIQEGLDGIEIIHPSHSKSDIEYFSKMAAEHFLLTSGGSDYHGGVKNDGRNFGNYCISMDEIINMKRRLFI
ncbi:MAG TPA: PHP domain-containing protein [Ignavibacteria bacterium]|nr:PHP domain-containing protein [Ignavibacteria bacterium]HMR39448.1 PHP domain-containing protein [Ignavibacteria bacterium]